MALTLILTVLSLTLTAGDAFTDPGDASAMHAIARAIGADRALNWSPPSDPCSQWPRIQCDKPTGRVTAIQLGNVDNITGSLPSAVANLTSLFRLELQFAGLGGPLPSLKGLPNLNVLLIHDNHFTSIPSDFFEGLTGLTVVSMDQNPSLAPWTIPESITGSASLVNFSANNASVIGGVPGFFSHFSNLATLALQNNFLGGGIPESFADSGMKSLWLRGCGLSGGLDVVAKMANLKVVRLQSNSFMGPIPDLSRIGGLEDLDLRDNKLTGVVPKSLTGLKTLRRVVLTNNYLQGPVPEFDSSVNLDLVPSSESFCHNSTEDCDPRVSVLLSIVSDFGYPLKFAQNWKNNDPCTSWIGISCDHSGNISVVNFQNMNLSGTISKDFQLLGSLTKLGLSNNNISGTIPPELVNLKNLTDLDLENNTLSGKVPSFRNVVHVIVKGNPNISQETGTPPPGEEGDSPSSGNGKKSNVGVIVGCVIAGIVVIGIIGMLVYCYKKMKETKFSRIPLPSIVIHPRHSGSDSGLLKMSVGLNGSETTSNTDSWPANFQVVEPINLAFSLQFLRAVTNNFSEDNILGRGGFGTVYKGKLNDGTMIAVKRMESGVMDSKGLSEFKSEIAILTKVRHRHLVSLLGYCLEGKERILVYEYMPQGTLSQHLFDWAKAGLNPLSWKMRLTIALDVARGVEYLHSLMNQSFIHRDLKPSNILLGNNGRAKVADFGLVRLAPEGKHCSVETRLAGTFGYLSPEYAETGRVTTKADVYSFGVILMELLTGRKVLDDTRPEGCTHLVTWFRRMRLNADNFKKAIDPIIDVTDGEISSSVELVSGLAGYCCARDRHQRPDMSYAVNILSSLIEKWNPSNLNGDNEYGIGINAPLPPSLEGLENFGNSQISNTEDSIPSFGSSMIHNQHGGPPR